MSVSSVKTPPPSSAALEKCDLCFHPKQPLQIYPIILADNSAVSAFRILKEIN